MNLLKQNSVFSIFTIWAGLFLFFISATGCEKFVTIAPPQNEVVTEVIFQSDAAATSSVLGMYSRMNTGSLNMTFGGLSVYTGLSSDEIYNTAANTNYDPYLTNGLVSTTATVRTRFWESAYERIFHATSIIEGLGQSNSVSTSIKQQLLGEAKLVRALHYFYLVNLFGNVPLVLSSDYRVTATLPRVAVEKVYAQIIDDLESAEKLLSAEYWGTDNKVSASRIRPNKYAATALLARVYLYLQNWENAEIKSSEVIANNSLYALTTNMSSVFLPTNNKEVIWQIMPVAANSNTAEGNLFTTNTATTRPTFAFNDILFEAFESGDKRMSNWTNTNTIGGLAYTYPFKYKVRTGGAPYLEYSIVLRLAEQYLIRAEARARQNNITGITSAENDVNTIRIRAGLPPTTASDQDHMLLVIEKERQTELFCEWGHRWLDLKRTGRADAILSAIKGDNWQTTDQLYPIPFNDINNNPFLTQNPGYQ